MTFSSRCQISGWPRMQSSRLKLVNFLLNGQPQKQYNKRYSYSNPVSVNAYRVLCFSFFHRKYFDIVFLQLHGLSIQKMKFSIKSFFSKCDQIRWKLRIWSHLLKKSSLRNFIFLCSVIINPFQSCVPVFIRGHSFGT